MKALFPSLPQPAQLSDVFKRFPDTFAPIFAYHDMVLRRESPLSIAERELIAAYVSSLNACTFCFKSHEVFARAWGIDEALIEAMLDDLDGARVDDRLRPVLAYVGKLTETPAMMTEADAQAVYDAGWSEQALFDAVQVCATFNFMNRIVEGTGVTHVPEPRDPGAPLPRLESYAASGRALGIG